MNTRLKRIIGVILGILIVSVLCTAGAWAYIGNDVSDNISNGTVVLKLGNTTQQEALNVPNAAHQVIAVNTFIIFKIAVALSGYLSVEIPECHQHRCHSPENMLDGTGDLGRNTEMAFFLDSDGSGDWNQGDIGLSANGQTYPVSIYITIRYSG